MCAVACNALFARLELPPFHQNQWSRNRLAHMRTPNSAAYTTAKHGVLGFTRALAGELGKEGVRVSAIAGRFRRHFTSQARGWL